MDYAKKDHMVLFCNGNGKIIRKPFSIKNSLAVKHYLIDQVTKSCRQHENEQYQEQICCQENVALRAAR